MESREKESGQKTEILQQADPQVHLILKRIITGSWNMCQIKTRPWSTARKLKRRWKNGFTKFLFRMELLEELCIKKLLIKCRSNWKNLWNVSFGDEMDIFLVLFFIQFSDPFDNPNLSILSISILESHFNSSPFLPLITPLAFSKYSTLCRNCTKIDFSLPHKLQLPKIFSLHPRLYSIHFFSFSNTSILTRKVGNLQHVQ